MINIKSIFFCVLISIFMIACNSEYSHKKTGYYKIILPQHQYQSFNQPDFPYSFEYPTYGNIIKDSTYFDRTPENNYWINLDFPTLNARVFLSYKIIGGKVLYKLKQANGSIKDSTGINQFDLMVNDAFNLTNKNEIMATSISEIPILTSNGVSGMYFKVGGNAATAKQFFLTDSVHHFLRGALYFNSTPNADSLKPVHEFLEEDIHHMIQTFKWKNQIHN